MDGGNVILFAGFLLGYVLFQLGIINAAEYLFVYMALVVSVFAYPQYRTTRRRVTRRVRRRGRSLWRKLVRWLW